jgi:DNA helicase-2/ATP-dependent DNA helicase PcrA
MSYYHRPRARDDAHGYGKPSRFLTERLQSLCEVAHPDEEAGLPGSARARARLEVSLDHLW